MTPTLNSFTARVLSTLVCTTALAACGGGGGSSTTPVQAGLLITNGGTVSSAPAAIAPVGTVQASDPANIAGTPISVTPGTTPTAGSGTVTPQPGAIAPIGSTPVDAGKATFSAITDVRLQNTGSASQSAAPVTFGQIFVPGHLKAGEALLGRLDDNTMLPLQMDVKARHADGSVRHAIISAVLPSLAASTTRTLTLGKGGVAATARGVDPADLLGSGFTASVSATINGVKYSASADQLLKAGAKATWLAGAVANEWHVSAPLTTSAGVAHPHLAARFALRWYSSVKKARVDVTVENDWAYEPGPQNFTYDADVVVGGKSVYTKPALTHLTHARWRKMFWYGGDAPQINPMLNTKYLIASRALPNYDPALTIAPATLTAMGARFSGALIEPMATGLATAYMPMTGGRDDIGLLPAWAVSYALTMDPRARTATLGTADLAGSYSAHFRDRNTDRPVSLKDYPYMTIMGRSTDTYNPVTKRYDAFPDCGGDCATPNTHDNAHQPGFAYLPYLVTGDYYYLEELQFWAMWNVLSQNPGYREAGKGLISPEQVRGQAWGMRSLAQAAYITPDTDSLKADFVTLLDNNLEWFNATYTNNATANKLGMLVNGYALGYGNVGVGPWQDDFFTSAIGHAADLGFDKAKSLLVWKAKFPVGRMTGAGFCWIDGAAYVLNVRASETSPFFTTMAEVYAASHTPEFNALACNSQAMASNLGLAVGEMTGYSTGNMGYPSNMQPALAYAVDAGAPGAKEAWTVFMNRTVKPDYSTAAEFAIVPR